MPTISVFYLTKEEKRWSEEPYRKIEGLEK